MLIQRVNRTDAEKVFLICHNQDGDSITTGMGARFLGGIAAEIVSTNGSKVIKVDADSSMPQFAGIADQDIPTDGYGRIQAFGYVDSVLLSAEADKTVGVTGIANSFLKAGAVNGSFTSTQVVGALSTFAYKTVQAWTTTNISGGLNYASGFVRAL